MSAVPRSDTNAAEMLLEQATAILYRKPLPPTEEREADAERLEQHLNEMDKRRGSRRAHTRR